MTTETCAAANSLTGSQLHQGFQHALELFKQEVEFLNDINIYPIADGDTGTNMLLTLEGAMQKLNGHRRIDSVLCTLADGSLETAKGNSGIILSQFFCGLSDSLRGRGQVSVSELARAFVEGSKAAYLAVTEPVEGTILTVMREVAEEAIEHSNDAPHEFFRAILEKATESLGETAGAMEELKGRRVVDSGAYGFVLMVEGLARSFMQVQGVRVRDKVDRDTEASEKFCTNFLVELQEKACEAEMRDDLRPHGSSLIVVSSNGRAKVHIHTNEPSGVEQALARFGSVSHQRVEEMW